MKGKTFRPGEQGAPYLGAIRAARSDFLGSTPLGVDDGDFLGGGNGGEPALCKPCVKVVERPGVRSPSHPMLVLWNI